MRRNSLDHFGGLGLFQEKLRLKLGVVERPRLERLKWAE